MAVAARMLHGLKSAVQRLSRRAHMALIDWVEVTIGIEFWLTADDAIFWPALHKRIWLTLQPAGCALPYRQGT